MRYPILIPAILAVTLAVLSMSDVSNPDVSGDDDAGSAAPPITLESFPVYHAGLPMVVAVTVVNETDESTWYNLPEASLFDVPGPFGFTLEGRDGSHVELSAASPLRGEGPRGGFTLRPRTSRRFLFDVSALDVEIPTGRYTMRAAYVLRAGASTSNAVDIEVRALSPEDSALASRLSVRNERGTPSWARFVDEPVDSPEVSALTGDVRAGLALHLYLREVALKHLAAVNLMPSDPAAFASGPLKGEASLYRLEILTARGEHDAADALAAEIAAAWPGLAYRIEEIRNGQGLLKQLARPR